VCSGARKTLGNTIRKLLLPFLKQYGLHFLNNERIDEYLEQALRKKIKAISKTTIGNGLEINEKSSINNIPITNYGFYNKFFEKPHEGDFIYPIKDYVKLITSGTMGKPKIVLMPRIALWDNMKKTGLSTMLLLTHDGNEVTLEIGDVFYTNIPGGSHMASSLTAMGVKQNRGWIIQCPDNNLPFQQKVDYFVDNYQKIDVAYMTVTTLLDEIYPRIGEPFHLKGFITLDRSARILKENIKKVTGTFPKAIYGASETLACSLPSIEHSGAFFFDWRIIYPEFIPEEKKVSLRIPSIEDPPETVKLMDVKTGNRYQIIGTPFKNDMIRYALPDILTCIAKKDDVLNIEVPIFTYFSRADEVIVLHNFTRIVEEELMQAFKESDIPFVDFTARRELEGTREYMTIYLETSSNLNIEKMVKRLHESLVRIDSDWRDLTDFLKYIPLKIKKLPKKAFQRYLENKKGLPKIERIKMKEENFQNIIKFASDA
jgi:hypothetical protein